MGFLDKLMPQPRWKHADPAIRLEAVKEVDDTNELFQLAEADPDARVRRAALARIEDVSVLGRIAGSDADEETRERAADRLVALAGRGADGPEAGAEVEAALEAARAVSDVRRLSTLAKGQAAAPVRAYALSQVADERALGSIARQARDESTAAAALARIADPSEIREVALHGEHKDVALAAFDRLQPDTLDLADLRSIELHAHQKAVSRRARTLIQDIETAEAARQTAALERQRRESMLCESMEQLASVADTSVLRSELERLNDAWQTLEAAEAAPRERFTRAVAAVEAAINRREREADEEADRQRLRAEAIATRVALCERVETLEGDDVLEQLVPIEEEWRSLLPLVGNGPEADRLAQRFAHAVAACRKRHEMGAQLQDARTRLEACVVEAEGLVSLEDAAAADQRWQTLSREARGLTAVLTRADRPADEDVAARLAAVEQAFAGRQADRERAAEAARETVVTQLRRLSERARRVASAEAITLREGDRLLRDINAGFEAAGHLSADPALDAAAAELRDLQGQVAPRVRELREMDDWRRFANAQRQEQLISMAEAIVTSLKADEDAGKETDLGATARALRSLHTEWQQVAEAPRQTAQRLWDRFRTATDLIRSRCEPFFVRRREEQAEARTRRATLVEEAESLAASNDWAKAAARFQTMQTEWQALGRPAGDSDRQLFQRFRTAGNAFFARRREDLADRKKVWNENLERKEALCARAEQLADSTDWETAAAEIKRLQADWKTVGPVRKNRSDAIWTRFRTAADRFFERYHSRHEIALAEKLAEREALVVQLEALATTEGELPASAAEDIQQLRTAWSHGVPVPVPGMKSLTDRWQRALGHLVSTQTALFAGTDLDPQAVVRRMEKLVARVENLAVDSPKSTEPQLSATEQLAARLRQALASNAMGGRHHDEQKQRATADAVRDAQAAWQRLPPVSTPDARELDVRFRNACRRLMGSHERHERRAPQPREARSGGHRASESTPRKDEPRPEVAVV